ncbi:MAG: hypothetical protein Tsb0020_11080 [Haliangiales bacterium]
MPKRPPRRQPSLAELPIPDDLARDGMVRAWSSARGSLWRADVLELLGSLDTDSVDLVVADPPYAVAKESWDDFASIDAYVDWCDTWMAEVVRVLAPTGSAYVCGYSEILAEVKVRVARRFSGGCRWLIWYYRNRANLGSDWGRSHESILHLRLQRRTRLEVDAVRIPYNQHTRKYPERVQAVSSQFSGSGRRDRWQPHPLGAKPRDVLEIPLLCNGTDEKTAHPTQKPEELIRRFIAGTTKPDALVVDPFAGSGTTAVVAERLGRRWVVGDADARYVALARDRLAAATTTTTSITAPLSG